MKLRALLLLAVLCVAGQSHAGLFSDDEAHRRIQALEARIAKLEEKSQEASKHHTETSKQQTQSMFNLQTQIEAQNTELRKLRGQNEELLNDLQEAEKRQKDFYVDLDTRVRHFETLEQNNQTIVPPAAKAPEPAAAQDGPAAENRNYEEIYSLHKAGSPQKTISAAQDFLKKFPDSVHIPNVYYLAGSAYSAQGDCKNAMANYLLVLNKHSYSPIVPDAMLGVAACQKVMGKTAAAKKTLQQIIAKYPGSAIADKAKDRLKTIK